MKNEKYFLKNDAGFLKNEKCSLKNDPGFMKNEKCFLKNEKRPEFPLTFLSLLTWSSAHTSTFHLSILT